MTVIQQIITIVIAALGTMTTRFLPFLIFSGNKPTPRYIQYLGKALPLAVFAMLIVYCMKDVSFVSGSYGVPELIAIALTAATHAWKRQMLLSVLVGTVAYMLMVQLMF